MKNPKIEEISLLDYSIRNLKGYGTYTIEQRALVDFRDGLKPVQRRVLWDMYTLGLHHNKPTKKTARIIGDTIGKYHPHGESGTHEALCNMTQLPEPTVDGSQSNFGDYEDGPSAMRYTECRLTKYSDEILLDPVYLEVTPMVPNYDGDFLEPVYLPAKLPNLLINGAEGIATGCSSLIPSFSKESVIEILKVGFKNGEVTARDCLKYLKFNFRWGGECISSKKDLYLFYKTGKGRLDFRPKYKIKDNYFIIRDLAPRFNVSKKLEQIAEIKGVKDIEDNRSDGKIEFKVILKNGEEGENAITKIEDTITTFLNCQTIITKRHSDGETVDFEITNIPKLINDWIKWRKWFESRVVRHLIKIEKKKLRSQNWLLFAILHRKDLIKALESKDPKKFLKKLWKVSEEQVEFSLNLKVIQLAKLEAKKIEEKVSAHKKEIQTLKKSLKNINDRILKQLESL